MSLLDDLISYWKLDEASGNAIDAHGSNDLTDNNTVGSATGKISNARDFAAANSEYFSVASNSSLVFGDEDMTIDGWFRLRSLPSFGSEYDIVSKYETSGDKREYRVHYVRGVGLRLTIAGNGSATIFSQPTVSLELDVDTWYYFRAWHDSVANQAGIMLNNDSGLSQTLSYSSGIHSDTSPFHIGSLGRSSPTFYFDGLIDEVGLWRRILTTDERAERYNSGDGLAYPFDSAPEGQVDVTLGGWTIASTGESSIVASLDQSVSWSLESTGFQLAFDGQADIQLDAWSVNSEATVPLQSGAVQVVLDNWSVSAEAFADNTAQADIALNDWGLAAQGVSPILASLETTLDWSIQAAAQYGDGFSGALAATLDSWSVQSTSLHNVAGGLNVTLNDWTTNATAIVKSRTPRRLFASGIHANGLFGAR